MAACAAVAITSGAAIAAASIAANDREDQWEAKRPVAHDENWAATCIQSHYRGSHGRELFQTVQQAKMVKRAATKLKRLAPLEGKILQGGFPGTPVNASMQRALAEFEGGNCYERARDHVLRWFVKFNGPFTQFAIFLVVIFILNILVLLVFFWGAVVSVVSSSTRLGRRGELSTIFSSRAP